MHRPHRGSTERDFQMIEGGDKSPPKPPFSTPNVDLTIRLVLLGLLAYWSLRILAPFATILLWSAILAVALYPFFDWLARFLNRPRLAAIVVTLLSLTVVVGPVTWLSLGLIGGVGTLVSKLDAGQLGVPLPPETVKNWPLVGERLHELWTLSATNMKAMLVELAPKLKPVSGRLLDLAQNALLDLLQFIVSIAIAGFLFLPGPQLVSALRAALDRVLGQHGREMVQLTGATIRSVSRAVVGVALLQAFLAGVGFQAAGVPAASVLAFVALLLGIVQIGPTILIIPVIIWSWTAMATTQALIFTAYMLPVSMIDNVLKPVLMARGLVAPIPVVMIGVVGGTLTYGVVGLFLGPIVLCVAWTLAMVWMKENDATVRRISAPASVDWEPPPNT